MPDNTVGGPAQSDKPVWCFILCWTVLNAVQAFTLEVHADEAYYWLYSRMPDWGYFDHPPMVAVFIRIGYAVFKNEFGLRLVTVLSGSLSLYFLWLLVKQYGVKAKWFILIAAGTFIFHIYGFTATPDAPLFLFTVLFYLLYKRYLENDRWITALLLGFVIASLLYSKYHGLLLIGFTLVAHPAIFKRRTFWVVLSAAVTLFIPHIWWQVAHHYPSIKYHLVDRSAHNYSLTQSISYLPAQLAMAGPLIGWFVFYSAFKCRVTDVFTRCLMVNAAGAFIFFFASTLKGEVQPHWTLIGFVPLIILALVRISKNDQPAWLGRLAVINILIIVLLRISIMFGPEVIKQVTQLKSYYGFKEWATLVKQKAGTHYVIMSEGFQNPSKYNFYTGSLKGFSYDSRDYRLTQYDIWPIEDSLQGQRAYFLSLGPVSGITTDSIKCPAGTWYGGWVDDVRTYQKVVIEPAIDHIKAGSGKNVQFYLSLTNPYPFAVNFTNYKKKHQVFLEACLYEDEKLMAVQQADGKFNLITMQPNKTAAYRFNFTAPLKKGNYSILFSLRTQPFGGSRNSRLIKLTVQ